MSADKDARMERIVNDVVDLIEKYWDELQLTEEEREERTNAFHAVVERITRRNTP